MSALAFLAAFTEVWFVDFEFNASAGEHVDPICMVAREAHSGRMLRLWRDDLLIASHPPYSVSDDALLVAYYGAAEMACHLQLGWALPSNLLDLFTEFRCFTNGTAPPCGSGLLGALAFYGLPGIDVIEKESMRDLAMRGGPWTASERAALLDYCETDVTALEALLPRMAPRLDLPRALLRGRYMKAVAKMERTGVPLNVSDLDRLRRHWLEIQSRLVNRVDSDFGVYEGGVFRRDLFAKFLQARDVAWPRLPSGALALDDDTFRDMARAHPEINPLRELRCSLSQMRLNELSVGRDGRNRCMLSAFRARTGRNQPSTSAFIFGPAVWLRFLIQPSAGRAVAYVDWEQQEFGIAAALSHDANMLAAYVSGDPYLAFAKQAGAAPPSATKRSHSEVREQFKACALAVQYGMSADGLAMRIGRSIAHARELLDLHHRTYRQFWRWSDAAVDHAVLRGSLHTVFGWNVQVGSGYNSRSLRNFPMQANGAELLRLACCLATEGGSEVAAPVHDALLVEGSCDRIDDVVSATESAMGDASEIVLGGFRLRTEARVIRYPERYSDPRGARMWALVWSIVHELERGQ